MGDDALNPALTVVHALGLVRFHVGGVEAGESPGEGLAAEQAEDGRQQGQGDQHRDDHGGRGRNAHRGEERDVDDREGGECDHDGAAGEHDRRSGGADGPAGRIGAIRRPMDLVPVSGHDEQRVVDTHGEADHRGKDRRLFAEVEEVGAQLDAEHADGHAHDRGDDGHAPRDE